MAIVLFIAMAGTDTKDSGATSLSASPQRVTVVPEKCPDARQAVRFYSRKLGEWRAKMGAAGFAEMRAARDHAAGRCPHARRLAHVLQRKAYAAHRRYLDWHFYHYRWDHWLPGKFFRVARCETGYGGIPRWDWDSGTYVSAFGILRSAYRDFAHRLGIPSWDERGLHSPREQYRVAAAIQARYGWSAWGCGGA